MQRQEYGDHGQGLGRDLDTNIVLDGDVSTVELSGVSAEDGTDEGVRRLSDDEVFEVLYNRRRRDIITYLREEGGTATASDLAEYIAAKENDTTVQQLSSSERKRVYVGLYQNHLPMMDDFGVVDYEKNRGTVELRACAAQLEPYLDDTVTMTNGRLKAVEACTLAGLILLGVLDVGVFAVVPDLLWIALGIVGFFGLVTFDAYELVL